MSSSSSSSSSSASSSSSRRSRSRSPVSSRDSQGERSRSPKGRQGASSTYSNESKRQVSVVRYEMDGDSTAAQARENIEVYCAIQDLTNSVLDKDGSERPAPRQPGSLFDQMFMSRITERSRLRNPAELAHNRKHWKAAGKTDLEHVNDPTYQAPWTYRAQFAKDAEDWDANNRPNYTMRVASLMSIDVRRPKIQDRAFDTYRQRLNEHMRSTGVAGPLPGL